MENGCKTYLGSASFPEKFVVNLINSEHPQLPPAICSNQKTTFSKYMKKRTTTEDEIGVFGAERYYSMKLGDENPRATENCGSNQGKKKENRADLQYRRQKSRSGTPSVSSESSWNSQAALRPSFLRNPSENIQNKTKGRNLLANLSCYRSCSDKKSIIVHRNLLDQSGLQGSDVRKEAFRDQQIPVILDGRMKLQANNLMKQKPKSSSSGGGGSTREQLALPISCSQVQNFGKIKDEDPRISLDVFGSNKLDMKELVAMNLEKKLSVLTWDAIPKAKTIQSTSRANQANEDIGSDASSDLFEIENLSGSNGQASVRQASDGISSSMTANACYEPSEASIEWSAVTASAADFSSYSDYNENKLIANNQISSLMSTTSIAGKTKITGEKDVQKSHPVGLLGCKNQKAVCVAEAAYRTNEKLNTDPRHHPRLESNRQATKTTG